MATLIFIVYSHLSIYKLKKEAEKMPIADAEAFSAPDPGFFILTTCLIALAWAGYNFKVIEATNLNDLLVDQSSDRTGLKSGKMATESQMKLLREVYEYVRSGAGAFLLAEYSICLQFVNL